MSSAERIAWLRKKADRLEATSEDGRRKRCGAALERLEELTAAEVVLAAGGKVSIHSVRLWRRGAVVPNETSLKALERAAGVQ